MRRFLLKPETAQYEFSLEMLGAAERLGCFKMLTPALKEEPVTVAGIRFPNAVGLAAGLIKMATASTPLARPGFGFLLRSAPSPHARKRATPNRVCFASPSVKPSSTAWALNNKGGII